jgi:PAS domain S-box-containing protein
MDKLEELAVKAMEEADIGFMLLLDESFTVIWANKFVRDTFGDVIGKKCYTVTHKTANPPEFCPLWNFLKSGGERAESEFYDQNLDRWFLVKAEKHNSYIQHFIVDITEKMELKRELEEREEFYRKLTEISTPIFIAQGEVFVYVNSALADFLGYGREELINAPFARFVHPEDLPKSMKRYQNRLKGLREEEETYPIRVRTKFGDKWVILSVKKIRFGGKDGVLGLLQDIDGIYREKVAFEELQRILRHDIKNALTSAFLNLELIKDGDISRVSSLEESLIKIRELVSHSVDVKMKPVDVAEFIEKAATGFEIELSIKDNCTVLGDDSLYSVFHNIIDNAVKHGKAKRVWVEIKPLREFCEIRIANDGIGIPSEVRDRIFDGVSIGKGSGKGLRFVKETVERLGGKVWLENSEDGKVVFVFRLRAIH